MAFISELIGKPVTDFDGKQIGVLKDLVDAPIKILNIQSLMRLLSRIKKRKK